MRQVYCDNGSTSFPKAPGLGSAIANHIDHNGYNISRGGYSQAYSLEGQVIETKEMLCSLFHHPSIREVAFTSGATVGVNMVLNGLLKTGDHVITTAMEHNAVVRPLAQLVTWGVEWDTAFCDEQGVLDLEHLRSLFKENTKLVLVTHGSNVCGTMTPIEEIGKICKEKHVWFAVDCAQTAGSALVPMDTAQIDALIFPGHKGLMGPQGIGGVIIRSELAEQIQPVILGGTGSVSDKEIMPDFMPDKFQPGTMNIPGIIGLRHSLEFVQREGISSIKEKKMALAALFLEGVNNMDGVRVAGKDTTEDRCAVVSLDFIKEDNAEISFLLESEYGIMTRCGMHCAPHAHKTLKTFPQGTVRFSFGYFNTEDEIRYVINSIYGVLKK